MLRGLAINGLGGLFGVRVEAAARLRIEHCVNMSGNGIQLASARTETTIVDTDIRGNTYGIAMLASGQLVVVAARSSAARTRWRAAVASSDCAGSHCRSSWPFPPQCPGTGGTSTKISQAPRCGSPERRGPSRAGTASGEGSVTAGCRSGPRRVDKPCRTQRVTADGIGMNRRFNVNHL